MATQSNRSERSLPWLAAARPQTLPAAAAPVLVGSACAFAVGGFSMGPAIGALLGALWIQIGTNFANDVFDHEKGADTSERLGPARAVASGWISPNEMKKAMALSFFIASAAGIYLTWVAGPWIIAIGLVSILSGIAYTGGPFPLGYHGLGDVFVMIFFGFVAVCGTAFVHLGTVPTIAWYASVPLGAWATAILVVNNVRDASTDIVANKRTVIVRFGRRAGVLEYAVLHALAYASIVLMYWTELRSAWVLLPCLTAPFAVGLTVAVAKRQGPSLNPILGATARLLMMGGALLAVGLVLATSSVSP